MSCARLTALLVATVACAGLVVTTADAHPASGIVVGEDGQVYFADTGHGIWRIDRQGRLSSLGEPAFHFLAIDRRDRFTQRDFDPLARDDVVVLGRRPTLLVGSSYPVTVGSDGAFYYPTVRSPGRVRIMRMLPGEPAARFADLPAIKETNADGKEFDAEWVRGLAAGPNGSLYYSELKAVRRISDNGTVTTVAEDVRVAECEHPPAATEVRLEPGLYGLDVAPDGTVFVAATVCSAVVRITPRGETSVVLRATDRWTPHGVAVFGEDLYVLEYDLVPTERREDWFPRVRKLTADGTVSIVAEVDQKKRDGK